MTGRERNGRGLGTLSLGICCGATTISMVELAQDSGNWTIREAVTKRHDGNPKGLLNHLLADRNPDRYTSVAVTGRQMQPIAAYAEGLTPGDFREEKDWRGWRELSARRGEADGVGADIDGRNRGHPKTRIRWMRVPPLGLLSRLSGERKGAWERTVCLGGHPPVRRGPKDAPPDRSQRRPRTRRRSR